MNAETVLKTLWSLGYSEKDLIRESGISQTTLTNFKAGKKLTNTTMLRIQFGLEKLTKLSKNTGLQQTG